MPFAGYQNFDECVKDQVDKGKSEESAKKICGMLMREYEKSLSDQFNAFKKLLLRNTK